MDNRSSYSTCAAKPVLEDMHPELALVDAGLEQHLTTNDPPTLTDTYALKSSLLDLRRALSQVNCRISEAEAEVLRLKRLRDYLHSSVHGIQTVLHPVRSLPEDILATIFMQCIPSLGDDKINYEEYDSLDPMSPAWTLSSVCRRWRDIVLSLPRMWSFVCLSMTFYTELPLSPLMFRLGLHLRRSGNVELDIVLFVVGPFGYHGSLTHWKNSILPLLLTTTSRWRFLRIACSRSLLDSFSGCPFDKLARLKILFMGHMDSDDVISCFQHASQLKHISTNHGGKIEIPWDGVMSYECSSNTGLSCIPQMSSLEQLTLLNCSMAISVASSGSLFPIRLPSLLRLTIVDSSPSFAQALPDMLHTPALHTLCLHFYLMPSFSFPNFRQSPNAPSPKNVSIVMYHSPTLAELAVFFEMTAQITNLYMSKRVAISEVLDTLRIVDEESGPLLPQLKSLRLDAESIKDDCDRVIALVGSRLEELRVVGNLDREWPEDEREPGEASRWRKFCDRVPVIHVLENDF